MKIGLVKTCDILPVFKIRSYYRYHNPGYQVKPDL